jgi:quinohemoprotein ethanol dehydrogenase
MRRASYFTTLSATLAWVGVVILSSTAQSPVFGAPEHPSSVDDERIANAERDPANWVTYGRTYSEQRYSSLQQITVDNARQLGLAWFADLDTNRGQEATPLVIDGVMYVSTAWSMVKAYEAKTGKLLWSYDPEVPREFGVRACCDVVNRGVAAWHDRIFVATLDGRLVALDAATGKPVWTTLTVDKSKPYTITQAPRVIKGRVLIGTSGSEYGVRGYLSAYDAQTGKLDWRFYTVPGDPSKPFENDAMAMAAKTWSGEWWKMGGGGTVWESLSYDPDLNLIYFGVSNGLEWNRTLRSAGKGDNLFLASIVAVDADSGSYVWHYQTTPGDEWDYDAVEQLMLADLKIGGVKHHVLMQANKNGFFYVLDRKTGKLLSARNFAPVTWARGVDLKTGRPIENPGSRYDETNKPSNQLPGPNGAHNWQSMAFNPHTGLVYIPTQVLPTTYAADPHFKPQPIGYNLGTSIEFEDQVRGYLLAWDPVRQQEAWRVNYRGPWNGGVLATAGNLVVEGSAAGELAVYRADTGDKLWSMDAQSGIVAAPMTFEAGGEQYIAVLSGWGGAFPLVAGRAAGQSGNLRNVSRVLVFKLGGTAALPALTPQTLVLQPPPDKAEPATVLRGQDLFGRHCGMCHGQAAISGGVTPDLRASQFLVSDVWYQIVLDGLLKGAGMVSFSPVLDRNDATAIRDYVIHRSNEDRAAARTQAAR